MGLQKGSKTIDEMVWDVFGGSILGDQSRRKTFPCSVALVFSFSEAFPCSAAFILERSLQCGAHFLWERESSGEPWRNLSGELLGRRAFGFVAPQVDVFRMYLGSLG